MKTLKIISCFIKNIQIQSAIVWAITILACSSFTQNKNVSLIIYTAAGIHLLMLNHFIQTKKDEKKSSTPTNQV